MGGESDWKHGMDGESTPIRGENRANNAPWWQFGTGKRRQRSRSPSSAYTAEPIQMCNMFVSADGRLVCIGTRSLALCVCCFLYVCIWFCVLYYGSATAGILWDSVLSSLAAFLETWKKWMIKVIWSLKPTDHLWVLISFLLDQLVSVIFLKNPKCIW